MRLPIHLLLVLSTLTALTALLPACVPYKTETTFTSPDGQIEVDFFLDKGISHYKVNYKGQIIIAPSPLGFEEVGKAPLKFDKFLVTEIPDSGTWKPVWGQQKKITQDMNTVWLLMVGDEDLTTSIDIHFKVFNDGVAFRYNIPQHYGIDSMYIQNELTQFRLKGDWTAWWIPANYDSYEQLYTRSALSDVDSVNTPITLQKGNDLFISIHEANLTNYPGMTLKKTKIEDDITTLTANLVPWPDGVKVKGKLPLETPWRTIQITDKAGDLLTSSLILNCNEPSEIRQTNWIKPMKYVGIWWGMHLGTMTWQAGARHGATTANTKRYIDFAAANNIQGVLVEGWNTGWDKWGQEDAFSFTTPYPDFDIEELSGYAKARGVALIGHHETGGDIVSYEKQLKAAFEFCQQHHIPAVKTGYAGGIIPRGHHHHGQLMVQHYRKVLEMAAFYEIMLDVHEPIKATGLSRTYPNMMTREGVRGMEWNAWSTGNPPEHTTILPFTRGLAGPIDYTPGIFDLTYEKSAGKRILWNSPDTLKARVHTTLAKQLALYVVLYSPMQMAADLIENYEGHPAFEFIRQVPVTWDTTLVPHAAIGDYVTIVRKKDNAWYLGSITDEHHRELSLPLDFLDAHTTYRAIRYKDADGADWQRNPTAYQIDTIQVTAQDQLTLKLAPGGGQAIRFEVLN